MMFPPLSARRPAQPRLRVARRLAVACLALTGLLHQARDAAAGDPPPVVFEGLGLGGFEGTESVSAALGRVPAGRRDAADSPIEFRGIAVQGPNGRDAAPIPLTAEVRSRVDRFDLAAGLLADPAAIEAGPSLWTGRLGLANDGRAGRESLELRTTLAPGPERSLIGVAVGPRVERRLGGGMTFFLDGHAEAQAARPAEAGWWTLPGTSLDDLTTLGVAARTGLVR